MKNKIKEYVDQLVGEVYNEDLEFKICSDVFDIVTECTEIPETSDNSCIISCDSDGDRLKVDVYYKNRDDDNEEFKQLEWLLTRSNEEFSNIL